MAKRRVDGIRVDSDEAQSDSYILLRPVAFEVVEALLDSADSDDEGEAKQGLDELFQLTIEDWDWVDEDDNPLPVPGKDGWRMGLLTTFEIGWLSRNVTAPPNSKRNAKSS